MPKSAVMLFTSVYFFYILSSTSNVAAEWTDEKLPSKNEATEDTRELLGVLYNVLEKLQNRRMASWERRQSRLPSCNVGDFCTVKKGPRFGQLCDCPRGSKCNHFFLKCL